MLTREQIQEKVSASRFTDVEIESLGGGVRLRKLSYAEVRASREKPDPDAYLIAQCVCGDDSSPIFTPDELGDLPPEVIQELAEKAAEWNGLTISNEDAEKN